MRLPLTALLVLASASSVSYGCPRKSTEPGVDYTRVELHAWKPATNSEGQYWVTQLDPHSGCLTQRHTDPNEGITYDLRDCSLASLVRSRVAELVAVFEVDPEPHTVGARIDTSERGAGQAVVFERHDGTRWTSESRLLETGAQLLDAELAELSVLAAAPTAATPTPDGWTELSIRDQDGIFVRQLGSSGRWSCESWLVSEISLEHVIVTRRGRVDPSEAATLLDSFAKGIFSLTLDDASAWALVLTPAGEGDVLAVRSDELVGLWDTLAAELDPACGLDPPPRLADLP